MCEAALAFHTKLRKLLYSAAEVLNEPNPYIRSVATAVGITIASQNDADVHELSALCFKMVWQTFSRCVAERMHRGGMLKLCTRACPP